MYNLEKAVSRRKPIYRQVLEYYRYCDQVRGMSAMTILNKTYVLNYFVRFTQLADLRQVSNTLIMEWIKDQSERGNTGRSINVRLAHLKAMLRWQQDLGLKMPRLRLGTIPKVVETPCRKVCFSRQQITRALRHADQRTWLLVHLAFDCGMRISELQNLRLEHLWHDRISIIGKGKKRRYAFLSAEVRSRLDAWITQHNIHDYLWPSPLDSNRPIAVCTIRDRMQAAFRRAGFSDFCPHDLRHSYATDLKRLGISPRKIQAGMGHSSELTTERYLSDLEGYDLREIYQIKYRQ